MDRAPARPSRKRVRYTPGLAFPPLACARCGWHEVLELRWIGLLPDHRESESGTRPDSLSLRSLALAAVGTSLCQLRSVGARVGRRGRAPLSGVGCSCSTGADPAERR